MMRRNDTGKKYGNGKCVTFTKRRKGLFKKAAEYCLMFGAQMAILVMSEAGRPYGFGHSSVDTILDRYLQGDGAPADNSTRGSVPQKKLKREYNGGVDDGEECDYKVADVKEVIAKEPEVCNTVEEMVALRDKCLMLQEYISKRVKQSHVLKDDNKAQCVTPKFDDFWRLTSKCNEDHRKNNINGGEDFLRYSQCSSMEWASKSKEVSSNSAIKFESNLTRVGNTNYGEGLFSEEGLVEVKVQGLSRQSKFESINTHVSDLDQYCEILNGDKGSFRGEDLVTSKVQHVSAQPSSELFNSTSSFQNQIAFDNDHGNNINGGDKSFSDECLLDREVQHVSAQPSSKCEGVNSTLSFWNNHHFSFGDNENSNINSRVASFWYEDLIDCKEQNVHLAQPSSMSQDVLANSTSSSEGCEGSFLDGDFVGREEQHFSAQSAAELEDVMCNISWSPSRFDHHHQGNNIINDSEGFSWDDVLEFGQASCPSTQPITESGDIFSKPNFSFETNNHNGADDHPCNNINGGEGSGKDLEHRGLPFY